MYATSDYKTISWFMPTKWHYCPLAELDILFFIQNNNKVFIQKHVSQYITEKEFGQNWPINKAKFKNKERKLFALVKVEYYFSSFKI